MVRTALLLVTLLATLLTTTAARAHVWTECYTDDYWITYDTYEYTGPPAPDGLLTWERVWRMDGQTIDREYYYEGEQFHGMEVEEVLEQGEVLEQSGNDQSGYRLYRMQATVRKTDGALLWDEMFLCEHLWERW